MIRWLALLLCLAALPARATIDDWPALYDVAGVAADDVLNVRTEPDAGSEIIGTLDPGATGIEVIRVTSDERWGLVNVEERAGWVSMRYMARQAGQWAGNLRPLASCYGTEPFWILQLTPEGSSLRWSTPEGERAGTIEERLPPANRVDVEALAFSLDDGAEGTGIVTARACSDGMTDREFGLRMDLVLRGTGEGRVLSGCCTLAGL